MGIEPIMVSSSVILIVAQRLARKICENCKEEEHLSETTLIKAGLSPDVVKDIKCYMGKGCPECNNTGYKGRIAVHEIMPIKDELKRNDTSGRVCRRHKKRKQVRLGMSNTQAKRIKKR